MKMNITRDKLKHKIDQMKENQWLQNNKKIIGVIAVVSGMLATTIIINNTNNSFNILLDGEVVGTMETQEEIVRIVEQVIQEKKDGSEGALSLNQTITIQPTRSKQEERISEEVLVEAMHTQLAYEQKAFKLIIDSETEVVVSTQQQAEEILKDIVKQELPENAEVELSFTTLEAEGINMPSESQALEESEVVIVDGGIKEGVATQRVNIFSATIDGEKYELEDIGNSTRQLQDLDFYEEVVIEQLYIDPTDIFPQEEAFNILTGNTDEIVYYELEEGDNLWDIAIENNTTMDAILDINPDIVDVTRMQIGDVVKIAAPEPILSIAKTQRVTFKELIPAEIEYVEFSDLYEDETKVYQEGHDGVKAITVLVHTVNGKETSRELLEEEVLEEAKIKVIAFGTQERPEPEPIVVKVPTSGGSTQQGASVSATSGMFMNPLNGKGTFTSGYGSRWGSFHKGIDIAAPSGTPIYASASGTVTYSGYNSGGYGYMVVIDHGNGYETYYAHNVANYVNVGDYVNKGENIAGVGSTGHSTGNHIHFEIRYNGSPVNPYSYVY